MNSFTKEELTDIVYALETVYLGNSNLRKKVQVLIDNYTKKCYCGTYTHEGLLLEKCGYCNPINNPSEYYR